MTNCNCRDCENPLRLDIQELRKGPVTLVTCTNRACSLFGVTREFNDYFGLSETQLDEYREMNKAMAARLEAEETANRGLKRFG